MARLARSPALAAAAAAAITAYLFLLSPCSGEAPCEVYNDQVATAADGLCVSLFAGKSGGGLQQPRGLLSSPDTGGDLLVADLGEPGFAQRNFKLKDGENGRVLAFRDANGNGRIDDSGDEWTVLARQKGINHGIAVHNGFLFASTSNEVYRWPYEPGTWQDLGQVSPPRLPLAPCPWPSHSHPFHLGCLLTFLLATHHRRHLRACMRACMRKG